VRARVPTIHPRAVLKGSAIRNKTKLIRSGHSLKHSIAQGAQNPIRIGPSSRIIGANIILKINVDTILQVVSYPNWLPGQDRNFLLP
jgi:hypothetical protein